MAGFRLTRPPVRTWPRLFAGNYKFLYGKTLGRTYRDMTWPRYHTPLITVGGKHRR